MISVCIATYNGELFLKRQLDTILEQIGESDEIIVADDSSSDSTVELVKKVGDPRLKIFINNKNVGVIKTFERAISLAAGEYIFLSDQDDVWFHDKIKVTLSKMLELELLHGNTTPLLVHTDLAVADENLNMISNSFCNFQGINPYFGHDINRLLVQNNITGCTVMINQALRQIALPISESAVMHDWWIGMIACCFGKTGFVDKPTILYRQHSQNNLGAKNYNLAYILQKLVNFHKIQRSYDMSRQQAMALFEAYKDKLNYKEKQIIQDYINLGKMGSFKKVRLIFNRKFFKSTICRNIGFILSMLFYRQHSGLQYPDSH